MKVGIYADAHFSKSSSIMNQTSGYKYSARLDSLINSYKWMYSLFEDKGVETVINLGDTVSSDVLDSMTQTALSEALSHSELPEYWLIGNHERYSSNSSITSLSLLKHTPRITLINDLCVFPSSSANFILKSYTQDEDFSDVIEEIKGFVQVNESAPIVVCTHQMYENVLPIAGGINWDIFYDACPNGNLRILNGHIHNPLDRGRYTQVGSLIGNSFSDDYSYSTPRVMIYDTESDVLLSYTNPYAPLFYSLEVDENLDFSVLTNSNDNPKYVRVGSKMSIKSKVIESLDNLVESNVIKAYRLKLVDDLATEQVETSKTTPELTTSNLYDQLIEFTRQDESKPAPLSDMVKFIESVKEATK